ncbi:MAG: VWA domain-containing protein [Flavobacteriales bacterium]
MKPYVKVFEEKRKLTLMLMIDVSASILFGTRLKTKKEVMIELYAVLDFSAIKNNDKIGALLFSNQVKFLIPPKKKRFNVLYLIKELIYFKYLQKNRFDSNT